MLSLALLVRDGSEPTEPRPPFSSGWLTSSAGSEIGIRIEIWVNDVVEPRTLLTARA